MALVKSSIEDLKTIINEIETQREKYLTTMQTTLAGLSSDTNYQLFTKGTELGKELDGKIQKILQLLDGLGNEEMQNVIKYCTSFVQVQEELNEGSGR